MNDKFYEVEVMDYTSLGGPGGSPSKIESVFMRDFIGAMDMFAKLANDHNIPAFAVTNHPGINIAYDFDSVGIIIREHRFSK